MKIIMCHVCNKKVYPELIYGEKFYPHRKDLFNKSFWQCTYCNSFVGCHPNTKLPLGSIVGPLVKKMRIQVHYILDNILQNNIISRSQLYKELSNKLGYTYHTANIRNTKEAYIILDILSTYGVKMNKIDGDF